MRWLQRKSNFQVLAIVICFILLTLAGCHYEEEEAQMRERQGRYAHFMRFESHLVWDRTRWLQFEHYNVLIIKNGELTICADQQLMIEKVIFVHSEEEAATHGLPLCH